MGSPPEKYTRDGVPALIRDFRSHEGQPVAWNAWKTLIKTLSPDMVRRFEGNLVRLANVPYTLAVGTRGSWQWQKPAASKRFARMPAALERMARDVEWASEHPFMRLLAFRVALERGEGRAWRDLLAWLRGTADSLRVLAKLIRRERKRWRHIKARKSDWVADETRIFLLGLEDTGRLDFDRAASILQPIYADIGIKSRILNEFLPNRSSLQALRARGRLPWALR
jgi:hypothetical protein